MRSQFPNRWTPRPGHDVRLALDQGFEARVIDLLLALSGRSSTATLVSLGVPPSSDRRRLTIRPFRLRASEPLRDGLGFERRRGHDQTRNRLSRPA